MSNVVPFESGNLPAHIAKAFGVDGNSDLTSGVSGGYPILSYRGKVWAVTSGGVREPVLDNSGDPRASLEVVLVKANPHVSKIFYPNGYQEGSTEKPACYSNDGVAPAIDAESRQAAKCAICPHNQWGSRISETGSKGKACADSRRVAVAPVGDIENPMLLRIPAASLRELANYANMLVRRQTPYQAVVTKIGFDHEAAYPKLTFKALRYLDEAEARTVMDVMNREIITQITTMSVEGLSSEAVADKDVDALGAPPAHVAQMQQAAKAEPQARPMSQVTVDEVAAVINQPVAAQPAPATKTTLLDAASSELDAVLAGFDDIGD